MSWNRIREWFWPLLEGEPGINHKTYELNQIEIDEEHLEKALNLIIDKYKEEDERKKSVESKSSIFIGSIGVVTSVILGITSTLVKTNEFSSLLLVLIIILFVLTIYMARTIWFSTKALTRKSFFTISFSDILNSGKGKDYYKQLIVSLCNKIESNSVTINDKVDNMTMAQEYFKRSIVIICLYSLFLLLFFVFKSINIESLCLFKF